MNSVRVGFGFDVHRFSKKRKKLILGGIEVPFSYGLSAVSDGDVVLHAVCDALCGACSLGDIGDYFPPQAKSSQGVSSRDIVSLLLRKVKKSFQIQLIDIVVVAERPQLSPHKKSMTRSLGKIFSCGEVNVKIKSKEGLAIFGGKNAIACFALVCGLKKTP
jgi:2-C-methyl-D-erythritol 2,4-cyclodiphosphate synthase